MTLNIYPILVNSAQDAETFQQSDEYHDVLQIVSNRQPSPGSFLRGFDWQSLQACLHTLHCQTHFMYENSSH